MLAEAAVAEVAVGLRREVLTGIMGHGRAVVGVEERETLAGAIFLCLAKVQAPETIVKVHVSTFRGLEVAGLGVAAVFFIARLVQIVLVGEVEGVPRRTMCALTFKMVAADTEAAANFLTHPVVAVGCPAIATNLRRTLSAKRRLIPTIVNASSNN